MTATRPDPVAPAIDLEELRTLVAEAAPGPWRRETGVAPSEEEHMVWLTNDAGDSLMLNADDVALLVNAALEGQS
jgi:hypothetical protein